MRRIGSLSDDSPVQIFTDYLFTLGIQSKCDLDGDQWDVWVHDEDRIEEARAELANFTADPTHERYEKARLQASELRSTELREKKAALKNTVDVRQGWAGTGRKQLPLTFGLIAISLVVTFTTDFGKKPESITTQLFICEVHSVGEGKWEYYPNKGLSEISHGQVWRLITPIFIHFTTFHLIFNMIMTYQFGGAVESRRGQVRFLALVLVIAILSNLGQYLWNGPTFGGMSGVVYGLFGYIWVKSRFEPQIGLSMPPSTVAWLIGWFFLCYTPLFGNVANTAHLVGLIVGASVSYFPVLWRQAMK